MRGVSRRKPIFTTTRDGAAQPAPDLVQRHFQAEGSDRLWVADITYVPTWAGFLYLAVVLDTVELAGVVGWAMATHLRTELVLAALDMAIVQRLPRDVIHHSDQGRQGLRTVRALRVPRARTRSRGRPFVTPDAYGQRCREFDVHPLDGVGRGRLRQCPVRELLRDPGV